MINFEWIQRLEAARFLFTKREQEIVTYLEEHFDALPQLSIENLVDATNTSRPTVHRFCRKMGYAGFKAFKQAMNQLNQSLKLSPDNLTPRRLTPKIASDAALTDVQSAYELFQKGFEVDIQALQRAAVSFHEAQISSIVDLILHADTLYCVGYQTGVFPARFLTERLSRLRIKTQLATGEHRAIIDEIFPMDKGDLLFLFEYHKDFDFHLKLFEFAEKRGAKTLLMTDYPTSPLVSRAAETLIVHRGLPNFKNSLAVPMTVVNNILLTIEFAIGDKRSACLQEWDELNEA